jgi:peptidoglycan/LPS O-acetylase OafA/YrhL
MGAKTLRLIWLIVIATAGLGTFSLWHLGTAGVDAIMLFMLFWTIWPPMAVGFLAVHIFRRKWAAPWSASIVTAAVALLLSYIAMYGGSVMFPELSDPFMPLVAPPAGAMIAWFSGGVVHLFRAFNNKC